MEHAAKCVGVLFMPHFSCLELNFERQLDGARAADLKQRVESAVGTARAEAAILCSYLILATLVAQSSHADEPSPNTPVISAEPTPQELAAKDFLMAFMKVFPCGQVVPSFATFNARAQAAIAAAIWNCVRESNGELGVGVRNSIEVCQKTA